MKGGLILKRNSSFILNRFINFIFLYKKKYFKNNKNKSRKHNFIKIFSLILFVFFILFIFSYIYNSYVNFQNLRYRNVLFLDDANCKKYYNPDFNGLLIISYNDQDFLIKDIVYVFFDKYDRNKILNFDIKIIDYVNDLLKKYHYYVDFKNILNIFNSIFVENFGLKVDFVFLLDNNIEDLYNFIKYFSFDLNLFIRLIFNDYFLLEKNNNVVKLMTNICRNIFGVYWDDFLTGFYNLNNFSYIKYSDFINFQGIFNTSVKKEQLRIHLVFSDGNLKTGSILQKMFLNYGIRISQIEVIPSSSFNFSNNVIHVDSNNINFNLNNYTTFKFIEYMLDQNLKLGEGDQIIFGDLKIIISDSFMLL